MLTRQCPFSDSDPVRVVLDTQSTDYITPFHRFKTTSRAAYDDARVRHGKL